MFGSKNDHDRQNKLFNQKASTKCVKIRILTCCVILTAVRFIVAGCMTV